MCMITIWTQRWIAARHSIGAGMVTCGVAWFPDGGWNWHRAPTKSLRAQLNHSAIGRGWRSIFNFVLIWRRCLPSFLLTIRILNKPSKRAGG